MATLKTAADVRSYFFKHWRQLIPDLLAPQVRVGPAADDPSLVRLVLADALTGPVSELLILPVASGEPRILRGLLPRLRDLGSTPATRAAFAVPHMGSAGHKLCREAGVGYLDCCGNAYLRFNRVIIQVTGNRNRFAAPKRLRTFFHDKATIPLRILLERPGAWLTTRAIAELGGLSLGWVSQILQRLNNEGYVERKRGGGTRLVAPHRLLTDWLGEYAFEQNDVFPFRLRTAGIPAALERLRCLSEPLSARYALTLEAAVASLTRESEPPAAIHLYIQDAVDNTEAALEMWSDALGLRPAGHGADCLLVRPAYAHAALFHARQNEGLQVVSDIQLYLDLFHYPAAHRRRCQAAVAARLPFPID